MQNYKTEFIDFMIECDVLKFGDFTTKSGRKSPFFINTGNFQSGTQLSKLGDFYATAIKEHFSDDFDILFGPAYKGIPLSVAASISLFKNYNIECSFSSNRKEMKDHGDAGVLLGSKPADKDRIIIIEDVTTAGTSIYESMPLLKSIADIDVKGLIIAVDRMEKGKTELSALDELQKEFGFKAASIVNMEEVVEHLYNKEINGKILINDEIKKSIDKYYEMYGA